jgi:cysteine desulfurase
MLVNNEIGVIQPIAELAALAHEAGAVMLCDAVQGYGRVPIPPTCDLVAVSAHKIYGPKGIGALWIRDDVTLMPLLHGGGQEAPGRSGTLSPALCAGFGVAATLMQSRTVADAAHVERLWALAMERLDFQSRHAGLVPASNVPQATAGMGRAGPRNTSGVATWQLNGALSPRYPGNLNIRRDGLDVARLMSDLRDIAFSAGSACASGSGRSSHVLRAIGLTEAQARSSIRIGFGRYTTEDDLAHALDKICAATDAQRVAA